MTVARVITTEVAISRALKRGATREGGNAAAKTSRSHQWGDSLAELIFRPLAGTLLSDSLCGVVSRSPVTRVGTRQDEGVQGLTRLPIPVQKPGPTQDDCRQGGPTGGWDLLVVKERGNA